MAGETKNFGLRNWPPAPATRPFELTARQQKLVDMARAGLAEPFRGINFPGSSEGLVLPAATGASLAPVLKAARAFVASLDPTQRRTACLAIEDEAWRQWSNFHPWLMPRNGICLADLDHSQREAALALMRETMSEGGYRTVRDVMRLNEHALEITGKPDEYSEWYYWISIFGTPSRDEPWGWQIDGHHLNINCFVLGDQLVMTPILMGSEPVLARFGKYRGLRVFAAEEEQGHALMRALSAEARQQATIGTDLPWEVFAGAYNDNRHIEPGGIRYEDLPQEGRERLDALLATYIGYIRRGHSELRWAEAKRHLVDTQFAWIGPFDDTSPFYYRILSPVILVEFDHQPGIVFDNDKPSRDHIHTLVRTPNGKDYGKDLLRQHYLQWHANDHGSPTNTNHKS
ncbi:DUF3500 domain-containing protein [Paraburkholderia sp. UYCP14C]|uniref:DUF3500 domain-containing protein n=1 Tax=Paraburkholderia sp. UYCP14C TaxID=2511130 RepID=UPI00102208B3|nr:DUF3500 domain-containing protein [Paraburkholderia sp. UYCP14C]RZF25791.1 DUF3500 domain-containing protein [Paraburkholderia sp. UYCP14C]